MRHRLGAIAYDLPRFLWSMRPSSDQSWVGMRNRHERLENGPNGRGVRCDWQWTSDLHIAKVFPVLGRLLMNRALRDWPIELLAAPPKDYADVQVSFIIGHRGLARLPNLLMTLQSIAAQRAESFECIVVEQSSRPEIEQHLPHWVRYVHTPLPYEGMPYCRSWAFNVGVRAARSNILILHDNDMLVCADYAVEVMQRFKDGYEVANLKRFIFYLGEPDSARLMEGRSTVSASTPESVVQNLEAGGSLAITRDAYLEIGGFDESFIGWGGEDNEFWDRVQTRRVWPYGYLPLIHLWHAAQAGKADDDRETAALLATRSAISREERIAELASRDFGNPQFASANVARIGSSLLEASLLRRTDADGQQAPNA